MRERSIPFHLYKIQFREEATLFPSSAEITDVAAFVQDVLRWSMEQKPKLARRWVVAEFAVDRSLETTIFSGRLVRLKKRRTIHFREQNLQLATELTDDADTLAFFLDGKNEYFLIQASSQIPDDTALGQFRSFFDKTDPRIRHGKLLFFDRINPSEQAIERVRRQPIRKLTVNVSAPNGEIDRAFQFLKPALRDTNADGLTLAWKSETGRLNVAEGSTIDDALALAAEYGEWKAVPYEKGATPIVSEETPYEVRLPPAPNAMLAAAKRVFAEVRKRLGDQAT